MEDDEKILELTLIEMARRDILSFTMATKSDYQISWHHRELANKLNAFVRGEIRFLMVFLPPRHGKLIASSTPVLTTKGWSTHGEIKTGDYVFHPSGKPIKVIADSSPAPSNSRVHFSDGSTIDCHLNHEWTVFDRSSSSWKTLETWQLKSGKGRCRYQLPKIGPIKFEEKNLPLHPYVLGAWLGDGTTGAARISYCSEDRPYIDKIIDLGFKVSSEYVHKITGVITTNFGGSPNRSGKMTTALQELGVYNKKRIPEIYKTSSMGQRLDLLAGLIDTDGHVEPSTGRCRIVTVSKELAEDIKQVAASLGWHPYITSQNPSLSTSGIQGKRVVYTVGFQPAASIPVALERKKIRVFAKRRAIGVTRIQLIDNGEIGQCIQVDSEDGLYLVGENLIPTHNSELVSRRLPAFIQGLYPDAEIMAASYLDTLASDMTVDVQNIIDSPMYQKIFPETKIYPSGTRYSVGTRNSSEHHIVGRRGKYRGQGVGGSFTGKGANFIIIDDPIKGREIADSEAFRDRLWQFYNNDLFSRLENDLNTGRTGQVLITQTRWHEDDLSGRLLDLAQRDKKAVQWEVLNYPAIRADLDTESDKRQLGEALWPEKYNLTQLEQIKASAGTRAWSSLYQQNPVPDGGALFSDQMFEFVELPERFDWSFITADTSYKEKQENDFTVFTAFGVTKNMLYIKDVWRQQLKSTEIEVPAEAFIKRYMEYGYRGTYIEPKGHGIYLNQKFALKVLMIPSEKKLKDFYADRRFDKMERANNVVPHLANRKVYINKKIANKEDLVAEALSFPKGKHDDFVDTLIDGLKMVYGTKPTVFQLLQGM